jgi:hypothetical protein
MSTRFIQAFVCPIILEKGIQVELESQLTSQNTECLKQLT